MKANLLVISERVEAFQGKRGRIENQVLALLDTDDPAMLNTLDYALTDEEKVKFSGKCVGKKLLLGISDAKTDFGGRLRLHGKIIEGPK